MGGDTQGKGMPRKIALGCLSTLLLVLIPIGISLLSEPRHIEPPPATTTVIGPVLSPDRIRRFAIEGVRLGMTLAQARRVLQARGMVELRLGRSDPTSVVVFVRRSDPGGAGTVGGRDLSSSEAGRDSPRLAMDFGQAGPGAGRVELIAYSLPKTRTARDLDARRAAAVQQFGPPTRGVYGAGFHELYYAPTMRLSDYPALSAIPQCLTDWREAQLCQRTDCGVALQGAVGPVLTIRLGGASFEDAYRLEDMSLRRDRLLEDPAFRRGDLRGATCGPYLME